MRSLRSTTALLALLVTVWSNLAAYPCLGAPSADEHDAQAAGTTHGPHHGNQGSHGSHETQADDGDQKAPAGPTGQECGILMSCGAAARAKTQASVQGALAPPLEASPFTAIDEPSAADRTQDPPPPRRAA